LKKLLALSLMIFYSAIVAAAAIADEWKLFDKSLLPESTQQWSIQPAGTNSPGNTAKTLTGINNPLTGSQQNTSSLMMGQLKLSFIDIAPNTDAGQAVSETDPVPNIGFHTGFRTSKFQNLSAVDPLSTDAEWSDSSFILFFGVNLNVGPGYFQSNAFKTHPKSNASRPTAPFESGFPKESLTDGNAKGFNAIAGYKLNDHVTLEAGYGFIEQGRSQLNGAEEAWGIYAQAILSLYPGVQVIPGIGQIDSDKNKAKGAAENFFAGAKWEINF
jgi:hypothetical protein